jgi:hypothetical protein
MKPVTIRSTLCNLQVCVPKTFSDELIEEFANRDQPTGIANKWKVITNKNLDGSDAPRYAQCERFGDCMHVVLAC